MTEALEEFDCLGGRCVVAVTGSGALGSATTAAAVARKHLEEWHGRFSRFEPASELCALNADPRPAVSVTPLMARFVRAAVDAAAASGGLVDPTLLDAVERAGYRATLGAPLDLETSLARVEDWTPAGPAHTPAWSKISVSRRPPLVHRPPGVRLDSGGIAKGLFADVLAELLRTHARFGIACAGDVRVGGRERALRDIDVADPFGGDTLHTWRSKAVAAATSGIGARSWRGPDGRAAHHLIDPATGRPAWTGVVQATALAPTAVEAEMRAKAALLAGPVGARSWLPGGGLVVLADGTHFEVEGAPPARAAQRPSPSSSLPLLPPEAALMKATTASISRGGMRLA